MRVMLLHMGEEADAMASRLTADGHHVRRALEADALGVGRVADPPEVLVVCLDAQPQQTLELAAKIGESTDVPTTSMLFVGGTPGILGEAQRRFPKASFARIDALSTAIASMEI